MPVGPVPWQNLTGIPNGKENLEKLIGVAGTLVTVATNPEQWLRNNAVTFVKSVIGEWIVGGILDGVQYVLGWILFGFERTATIILGVVEPLTSPFTIIGDAIVGGIESMYSVALGVSQTAGLAGPPAAAFAVALVSLFLAAIVYGVLRVIPGSDALEGGLEAIR